MNLSRPAMGGPNLKTPDDLVVLLGVPLTHLRSVIGAIPFGLRRVSKPKSDGGRRPITYLPSELMDVQDLIRKRILDRIEFANSVHGYRKGRSQVTAARAHVGQRELLSMDIKSFYPSIRPEQVRRAWRKAGCDDAVARMLTRLTTTDWQLPQGAPTSNGLANLVRAGLDTDLQRLADRDGLRYTSFSDNLFLSGDGIRPEVIEECKQFARRRKWLLHKERIMRPGEQKCIILGLVMGDDLLVPKEYLDETEAMIARLRHRDGKEANTVRGRVSYVHGVNPNQAMPLMQSLELRLAVVSPRC